jgi:hypothetical protein
MNTNQYKPANEEALSSTLMKSAKEGNFDPYGYRTQNPLRKRIFYNQPYLTCQYCNTIYFVSTDKTRYLESLQHGSHNVSLPEIPSYSHYKSKGKKNYKDQQFPEILIESEEKLPPCRNCHKVDGLVHGAHDFSDFMRNLQM